MCINVENSTSAASEFDQVDQYELLDSIKRINHKTVCLLSIQNVGKCYRIDFQLKDKDG